MRFIDVMSDDAFAKMLSEASDLMEEQKRVVARLGEWRSRHGSESPRKGNPRAHFVLRDGTTACGPDADKWPQLGELAGGLWFDLDEWDHLCGFCRNRVPYPQPCMCGKCRVTPARRP